MNKKIKKMKTDNIRLIDNKYSIKYNLRMDKFIMHLTINIIMLVYTKLTKISLKLAYRIKIMFKIKIIKIIMIMLILKWKKKI